MPRWQLVIQLDSEQPLTSHLYHVPNAAGHKTDPVWEKCTDQSRGAVLGAITEAGRRCPSPHLRGRGMWSGKASQSGFMRMRKPGTGRAGRTRQREQSVQPHKGLLRNRYFPLAGSEEPREKDELRMVR